MSIYMPSAKCAITTMSLGLTRPPLARPDDVNANKSLYGNKRETPSIRCPGFPGQAGTWRAELLTRGASMTTDGPGAALGPAGDAEEDSATGPRCGAGLMW